MNKRFLFSDNGILKDWTSEISDFKKHSKLIPFVATEDALLIGSKLPFNGFYTKLATKLAQNSSMKIEYWSNTSWAEAVEVRDSTGAFSESGQVIFTPNKKLQWSLQDESNEIPELSTTTIYNYYWLKVTFSSDLDVSTELEWIGDIFSNDDDLSAEYPDLVKSSVLSAYQTGKVNWLEQHAKAAEIIEHDLVNRGIIDGNENILERGWYKNASVQKAAEIIFGAFGDDYVDQRIRAREEYSLRLVSRLAGIDKNNNAIEDVYERKIVTGFLSR